MQAMHHHNTFLTAHVMVLPLNFLVSTATGENA